MLLGVLRVYIVGPDSERDVLRWLDGYARIKPDQPRVGFTELAHRKTLNGIPAQKSVDVVLDAVCVR